MTFLSNVFCCLSRSVPAPEMTEARPARPVPFRPNRQDQIQSDNPNGVAYNHNNHTHVNDQGYTPNIPLPRYTPRPMSIREKTLEAHMRDPPLSSSSSSVRQSYTPAADEKHPYEVDHGGHGGHGVTPDDVSSAFSFQSSYGNTSTATRETPPPPYSAEVSPVPTPTTRRSFSSNHSQQQQQQQQPVVHIAQPRAVFQRPEWMVRSPRCSVEEGVESRRFSWESR